VIEDIDPCPRCGALPCDWANDPHATPAPADASGPFEFERYVNGVKMAQGITIERETALQAAMRRAVEICPKYQGTVLVLVPATTAPAPTDRMEQ
jgi:hypothetical protein